MLRRQSIGQEGASAEFCDLSGRGLNTSQVERTLRVFDTAMAIDMSNNELEQIPVTIPKDLVALDVSFNLISHGNGLERLQFLQELNLGYNRLADVSILEFCPLLQRVNLSGNRLMNTRGIETLIHLENLNLSDNLIEYPEALRALSMNRNLTHLTIHGNPIAHKGNVDYRVLVLDMIPSILFLDDKKIRASTKSRQLEPQNATSGSSASTKSLSYSRIYDDKKQFVIRHQQTRRTLATRPTSILLGDPTLPPKYEGNTIFLQSPKATTITQDLSMPYPSADRSRRRMSMIVPPPPAPSNGTVGGPMQICSSVRQASPTAAAGAPYISLYDRLAAANGISVNKSPPPQEDDAPTNQTKGGSKHGMAASQTNKRPNSSQSRRNEALSTTNQPSTQAAARRSVDAGTGRLPSRGGAQPGSLTPATHSATYPAGGQQVASPTRRTSHSMRSPPRSVSFSAAPMAPQPTGNHSSSPHPSSVASVPTHHTPSQPPQSATPHSLDPKQQNVLSVIQNLIHHKKQTLATLARQSSSTNATTVHSS